MTIGWYPGHMHKAGKDIRKALASVDAVIETVDARIPYSSENPLLGSMMGATRRIKVLNKADLADPEVTVRWLEHYQGLGIQALALDKSDVKLARRLPALLRAREKSPGKVFRILVVGIPNSGKSTLINTLLDRKAAKTGDEPAVTKRRQEIPLNAHVSLLDTPGILWPKIEDQNAAYRLAVTGAIRNTAIEFEDIALFAVDFLRQAYPRQLAERYALESTALEPLPLLESIGRRRGCLRKGGVDLTKAGEILINDLRTGRLGRLSLETPETAGRDTEVVTEK